MITINQIPRNIPVNRVLLPKDLVLVLQDCVNRMIITFLSERSHWTAQVLQVAVHIEFSRVTRVLERYKKQQ